MKVTVRRLGPIPAAQPTRELRQLLCDLPDVTGRVGEARRSHPPLPVHRAVDELDAACGQVLAHGVDIVHEDRELQPRSGPAIANRGRLDQSLGSVTAPISFGQMVRSVGCIVDSFLIRGWTWDVVRTHRRFLSHLTHRCLHPNPTAGRTGIELRCRRPAEQKGVSR